MLLVLLYFLLIKSLVPVFCVCVCVYMFKHLCDGRKLKYYANEMSSLIYESTLLKIGFALQNEILHITVEIFFFFVVCRKYEIL